MKKKFLVLCGVLAPVVYLVSVLVGGGMTPGYSPIRQPVSDLIASGAAHKAALDPVFGVYNVLTLAFGFGLWQKARAGQQGRGKTAGIVGALVLVAEGVFGLITLFFPEDAGGVGAEISSTGMMHIVFAGLSSLTTMLSMLLIGFWFRGRADQRKLALYSFLSVGLVFVSGGLTAASIANASPIGGLLERITIGGFLQWMFVTAVALYRSKE